MAHSHATLSLIVSDVRAMVVDRGKGKAVYFLSVILKVLLFPRIAAVIFFRLGHAAYVRGLTPMGYLAQAVGLIISGAEIHPAADIGPGLCLVHSSGIVIGDRVRIGARYLFFHGVTLGDSGKGDGQPTIGDDVTASAGAKILGPLSIGSETIIGANAVLKDIPPNSVAAGVPVKQIRARLQLRGTQTEKPI